mmetsp:Transcript_34480/g.53562  ORF Transcript_34480/g.53562 Transcript_34480/m.53562 type:complete len:210 (-) Transcript_34480:140-769(-)
MLPDTMPISVPFAMCFEIPMSAMIASPLTNVVDLSTFTTSEHVGVTTPSLKPKASEIAPTASANRAKRAKADAQTRCECSTPGKDAERSSNCPNAFTTLKKRRNLVNFGNDCGDSSPVSVTSPDTASTSGTSPPQIGTKAVKSVTPKTDEPATMRATTWRKLMAWACSCTRAYAESNSKGAAAASTALMAPCHGTALSRSRSSVLTPTA